MRNTGRISSQRGASLLFALVSLLVLCLAAVGLVRSVDTGTIIAGNFGFKRDAIISSSVASQQAVSWLYTQTTTNGAALDYDIPASGYFASSKDDLDPTGNLTSSSSKLQVVNWDGSCQGIPSGNYASCDVTPVSGNSVNGNTVQWVITRLCDTEGPAGLSNLCTKPAVVSLSTASERGSVGAGGRISGSTATPYYRIVTRVGGGHNTVSYTETIVHF